MEQLEKLSDALQKYRKIFAFTPRKLEHTTIMQHLLDTETTPPVHVSFKLVDPAVREMICGEMKEMQAVGVIQPYKSPYRLLEVLVKMKDRASDFA